MKPAQSDPLAPRDRPMPTYPFAALALALGTCASLHAADPPSSKLSLQPKDAHALTVSPASATLDLRSPGGIGRTTLRSADGTWPHRVLLRLHLRGLEHFTISDGTRSLSSGVTSSGDHPTLPTTLEGKDAPLPRDHPLALRIKPVSPGAKKPSIPLDGFFEIEVPPRFLSSNPRELHLHWIDFYR